MDKTLPVLRLTKELQNQNDRDTFYIGDLNMNPPSGQTCACNCGNSRVTVHGPVLARILCHCLICQKIYQQPFADVVILNSRGVAIPPNQNIDFQTYRAQPAINRGRCAACALPVVGFLTPAPWLKLAFVPTENFPTTAPMPSPACHIFYHHRVTDAPDDLPKYSSYLSSEFAVTTLVLKRTLFG
jgi:hypothetical protein